MNPGLQFFVCILTYGRYPPGYNRSVHVDEFFRGYAGLALEEADEVLGILESEVVGCLTHIRVLFEQ